jgi:ferric-dicitrate binding protein FerR (iron transport regulator)
VALHLGAGQLPDAVEAGRQLLVAPQQRLPEPLESLVRAAVAAWDEGRLELAAEELGAAVELAQRLRYA